METRKGLSKFYSTWPWEKWLLRYQLYIDVIYLSPFPQDKDNSNLFLHLVKLGREDDPPALQAEPAEEQIMKRAFQFLIKSISVSH